MKSEAGTKEADLSAHLEPASAEALRLLEEDEKKARPLVARVLRKLGVSLGQPRLNVTELLTKCGLSRAAVVVPFRVDLRQTLSEYTRKTYFEIALWFLFHTKAAITAVGELAGFSNHRQFKRTVEYLLGISPQELELRAKLVTEKTELPGVALYSRRFWRKVQKGHLGKIQVVAIWELVQWLYPKAAKMWRAAASAPGQLEKTQINAVLMDAFWELLVPLSKAEQRYFVRQVVRCSSAELFHFLCGKSLKVGREKPARGVEVMELALEFLRGSAEELGDELLKLEVQGLARLANAYMLAGDFESSKRYLEAAREAWKNAANKDDMVEAEIAAYAANLHLLQGDFKDARKLFDQAIDLCGDKPPGRLLAQCLIQRSTVIGYGEDSEGASRDLRAAWSVLAHQDEPRLKLAVAGNLALFLALDGQAAEAEEHLEHARELCDEAGDPLIRQHLFWTQGLIHHARGEHESAAGEYEKAGKGFEKLHQPGYVAMVALDLALVRHEQGRFEDVVLLVARAVPVLEHFRHASGVNVALKMLREAVVARQVTREVLENVRAQLYALWRDPAVDLGAVKA